MSKTRKNARRAGESIKMKGWSGQESFKIPSKITSKTGCKNDVENHPKFDQKMAQIGSKIDSKWVQNGAKNVSG